MSISAETRSIRGRAFVPATALAESVEFDDVMMRVSFIDRRILYVPLSWFPVLKAATPEQRSRYEIGGGASACIGRTWMRTSRSPA